MIQVKNAAELEKMRRACAISAGALKAGGEAIEAGISTAEIDKIIYDYIVRHGARPNFLHLYGFPATACISVNDTVIHGIPSRDQKIRPGDIVSIDTGCKIDGFNGDNACTFACGKVDSEARRLMDVTKKALHLGIQAAQAGNRIGDIGHAVQSYVEENGFSVVRTFVGHGVGKELHEDPEVPNYGRRGIGPIMKPGMCIAIEPMINLGSKNIVIERNGWECRTRDRKPNIITSLELMPEAMEQRNLHLQEKYRTIKEREVRYETIELDDADIMIVAFGSAARIAEKAIELAREEGIKAGLFRPITLWPFPEKQIAKAAHGKRGVLVAEINAGQMIQDVRLSVNGEEPVEHFGRLGGIVPEPEEIVKAIKEKLL